MGLKHKYDPDYYYDKAASVLENTSSTDVEGWSNHPCTTALLLLLEGDLANLVMSWKDGGFTADTSDKTIQINSKAVGACQCIDSVLDYIKDIRRRDVGDNT